MLPYLSRRRALLALGAVGAPSIVPFQVWSQGLPDKPVSLLVGFAPGGSIDHLAHVVAPRLEARIGRHVRVENHPGNNGALVGEALKKGRQGGSLIGCIASLTVEAKVADAAYPFNPESDMVPLTLAGIYPMTLALSPKLDVETLTQYVEWLRDGDKTRTRLGSAAAGDFLDLNMRLIGRALGTPLGGVAYRGDLPMLNDLQDNKLPAAIASLPSALEYHRGGRIRIIATTADKRIAFAPKLQSMFEYGHPELVMNEWYGFFGTAGTAAPIVDLWNMHIRAVLEEPEAMAELTNIGIAVRASAPEELAQRVAESMKAWRGKMLALGMQPPG
jgi:tripartite-type tricarboxylate transporter receptor subunit TctC